MVLESCTEQQEARRQILGGGVGYDARFWRAAPNQAAEPHPPREILTLLPRRSKTASSVPRRPAQWAAKQATRLKLLSSFIAGPLVAARKVVASLRP